MENHLSSSSSFPNSSTSAVPLQVLELPNTSTHDQKIVRPVRNVLPDMWGDRFLTLPFTDSEFESCSTQVEVLKGKVYEIFMASINDPIENIFMINSLNRLGVSYHFEREIGKQLSYLFTVLPQLMESKDYCLHTVATTFQAFRSYGYRISCDVFNKFKNIEDGMFKEEVGNDVREMISLYEASQWRMKGEPILDEAFAFATSKLESIANQSSISSNVADYIVHALQLPYQRIMSRLDARRYISLYENDESRNDVLLTFAKYDFNRVQMLHQRELSILSSWWRKLNIESKFPYARPRLVELYVMAVITYFEPRFARGRNIFTKWYVLMTLIDDTYDSYGIYEELQHFTKAIESFDISAMDDIPIPYLKTLYETVLDIYNESVEEIIKEGRSYKVSHVTEELKKHVRGYDAEVRWAGECLKLPTFDEYLDNGKRSIGIFSSMSLAMVGMEEANQDAYRWLDNPHSTILDAAGTLWRLYDDLVTNEEEEERGGQLSGTALYMREYGVSREEANEAFREIIEDAWKEMNEGFMRPWPVPTQIMMLPLNLARIMLTAYQNDDGVTRQRTAYQYHIAKLLIHPIPIDQH